MTKSLGDRMKEYEQITDGKLIAHVPVVLRVDGRAFHTFTRGFEKPFDTYFINTMERTVSLMIPHMQGFRAAYVASDEMSFVILPQTYESQPWFGNRINKLVSVTASMATSYFNHYYPKDYPTFDCRAFNLPEHDVINYLLWRGKDWSRNSVSMYARANFSHKELMNKKTPDMHEMLHEKGLNWATDCTAQERNGTLFFNDSEGLLTVACPKPTYEVYRELGMSFNIQLP